jgi:hypothetical protein
MNCARGSRPNKMPPPASLNLSFRSADRQLDSYQFTFESYLDDSAQIEPDVCAVLLALSGNPSRTMSGMN